MENIGIKSENLRAAAYARVSTEGEDQVGSLALQRAYFEEVLRKNPGLVNAGVYADWGISGTAAENRTAFQAMLARCEAGEIDRILCKSLSRFARNTGNFLQTMDFLKAHHVTVYFEKEGLDTGEPGVDFLLTLLAAVAQEESRSISANVRWGYQKRWAMGLGKNYAVYGYHFLPDGRAVAPNPEEAAVVCYLFREAARGCSCAGLARKLNRRRIPAPGLVGWTGRRISDILAQERYCGDILTQKTWTPDILSHRSIPNRGSLPQQLLRNHHPAIVFRELFARVQTVKKQNSIRFRNKRPQSKRPPLSGKLICGCCGRRLRVRNQAHYPIWYCPAAELRNGMNLCSFARVYEEQILAILHQGFRQQSGRPSPLRGLSPEKILENDFSLCPRNGPLDSSKLQEFFQSMTLTDGCHAHLLWQDGTETTVTMSTEVGDHRRHHAI